MNNSDVGDRARVLHDLTKQRGWDELKTLVDEWEKRAARDLATKILRGDVEIDQREIDLLRAEYKALRRLLAQPDQAEKRFEEALRKRGITQ